MQGPSADDRNLCYECRFLDFGHAFESGNFNQKSGGWDEDDFLDRWIWNIASILANKKHCSFCRLLSVVVEADGHYLDPNERWTLSGGLNGFENYFTRDVHAASGLPTLGRENPKWGYHIQFSMKNQYHFSDPKYKSFRCTQAIRPHTSRDDSQEVDKVLKNRHVDDARANLDMIRSWIKSCTDDHEKCNQHLNHRGHSPNMTFRLLDLDQACLINAPQGAQYVALSYVWGSNLEPGLRLTIAEERSLYTPGALKMLDERIPKTIRDAMYICQQLGQRYLWVDALCIIQDSPPDKDAQIGCMSQIYYDAFFTIAGAVGDSHTGLAGARDGPARFTSSLEIVQGLLLSCSPRDMTAFLESSPWSTRGWTLQEQLLSRRLLIFAERGAVFKCQQELYREDVVLEAKEGRVSHKFLFDPTLNPRTDFLGYQEPRVEHLYPQMAFREYWDIVRRYSMRKLSNKHDILNAISGIVNTFKPTLGEFRYGLPLRFLAHLLLWSPSDKYPLTRLTNTDIPSWSWAGWTGTEWIGNNFVFFTDSTRVSLVQFCELQDTDRVAHIASPIDEIKTSYSDDYQTMAKMAKHHCTAVATSDLDQLKHCRLLEPLSRYLLFWTSSARLNVSRTTDPSSRSINDQLYQYEIRFQSGSIGDIVLYKDWRDANADTLEFIFISISWCMSKADIMLIDWVDNIAQRVQVASIGLKAWVDAQRERKLIILG